MIKFIPIQGTFGWKTHEWWCEDSSWCKFMKTLGWELREPEDPYVWSTDINGTFLEKGDNDWRAGAKALKYYLRDVPLEERILISHSHGLQVVEYLCGYDRVPIRALIDIAGPIRRDMADVTLAARGMIGQHVHVFDAKADWTAWMGQLFDGRLFGSRQHPYATVNLKLKGIGHSGLFRDDQKFINWPEILGNLNLIPQPVGVVVPTPSESR